MRTTAVPCLAAALLAAVLAPSVHAALPAGMREFVLDRGFYLSGSSAYVATYERYAQLSHAEAEGYAARGGRPARDLASRYDCLRTSSGTGCVFIPRGELALSEAMSLDDLASLAASSRAQVGAALASDVRSAPALAAPGVLKASFAALRADLRAQKGFVARYLVILNRLTYETKNRETDMTLHSGVAAWGSGRGVCDAYARLALYAAAISGLPARVETGDAWDAPSGRTGPHAWVRIGPFLLDPTFDDAAVVGAGGARDDRPKSASDLEYFALSGDLALADRAPDGAASKDLSPAATDARYWALADKPAKGPAAKLLAPYVKRRALGMGPSDAAPTAAQLATASVNGAIVDADPRELTYRCGAATCSAAGRSYLPLAGDNPAYVLQKYSLDRIRALSVVRLPDGTIAMFPPEGQGVE